MARCVARRPLAARTVTPAEHRAEAERLLTEAKVSMTRAAAHGQSTDITLCSLQISAADVHARLAIGAQHA